MRLLALPCLLALSTTASATPAPPQSASAIEDGQAAVVPQVPEDGEGAVSFVVSEAPEHGVVEREGSFLVYRPAPNFNGPDQFRYFVQRGDVGYAPVTVNIQVRPAQDLVQAHGPQVETYEDDRARFSLTATADAGVQVGWELIEGPQNGSLIGAEGIWSNAAPEMIYVPDADYFGPERMVFAAYDKGSPDAAIAEVPVWVYAQQDAPGPVTVISPASAATVTNLHPVLQWSTAQDVDGDPLTYAVRLWDTATNEVISATAGITSTRAFAQWRVDHELVQGRTYSWEAVAFDGVEQGPFSEGGLFHVSEYNAAPTGLVLIVPADGDVLDTDSPVVRFEAARDPELGSVMHEIEVDTARDFSSSDRFRLQVASFGGEVLVDLADYDYELPRFEQAHARVRALDSAGAATPWQVARFVAGGPNAAPSEPEIGVITGHAVSDCMWSFTSTDPDADDVQYEVSKVRDGELHASTSFYEAGSPTASFACLRTSSGTAHGVWVRAVDTHGGESDWVYADARKSDTEAAGCSVLPGSAGILPLGLVLLGLRRKRSDRMS